MVKSYEFIDEFSEEEWALTKSRFNPIKEDFGNTSFFVTDIKDDWKPLFCTNSYIFASLNQSSDLLNC